MPTTEPPAVADASAVSDNPAGPVALATVACHEPIRTAWAELDERLRQAAFDRLRSGARSHRDLISSVGLDGEPPEEWQVRSERLLEYRRGVDAELVEPLRTLFEAGGPAKMIERAVRGALEEATHLSSELPVSVTDAWPEGALARKPSDDLRRRVGKVFARIVSRARRAGRERSVPLRGVAVEHLEEVVRPALDEAVTEVLQASGEWSKQLELALVAWGSAALPALVRAELLDEVDEAEVWAEVGAAAEALQSTLDALTNQDNEVGVIAALEARLRRARESLEADLAVAGSFLLKPDPPDGGAEVGDVTERFAGAAEWDRGIGARAHLCQALLGVLSGATAVQHRMAFRFRKRCLARVPDLPQLADTLEGLQSDAVEPGSDGGLAGRLEDVDAAVAAALKPAMRAIPGPDEVDAAVRDISDATVDALLGMIRQAPTTLVLHAVDASVPVRGRKPETRSLALQELARQSFDALRIERIRSATSGLLDALDGVRTDISELEEVYSFARDEALRELEADDPEARNRADDLIAGSLRSIAEALRAQVSRLDGSLLDAQRQLAAEIADGSMTLIDRVGAGRMEAGLFAARSRATDLWKWARDRWGPPVARAWKGFRVQVARLRRLGARLLRRGSAIVGSAPPAAASARTLRALADTGTVTEKLPLVYQRLFTLEPIADPAMLSGREVELGDAVGYWKRWRDDDGVPLILRSRQGQGLTSFLNVFQGEIERDGGSVVRATLVGRIVDESAFAAFICTHLGLPDTGSLDELSRVIFDTEQSALPNAVILDNLEHLYLRVPGGTDLIERLLTLMSETEPRILWIAGITSSAWQLVVAAEPTATTQVDVLDLKPLGVSALRTAIKVRHRRSGLAIRYSEPTTGQHLLRRRLRRRRRPELFQAGLEADFFDRLHRTSGGHLGLALYQWLGVTDFESGDGVLMRQPERPDFSVLDSLSLTQNFTLKAFLEHRSLTLSEHDQVFRIPRQESYQIFESLRNRHLLEPLVGDDGGPDTRSEIEEELRYQVRPLLTGAVITHLQSRNIVH